MEITKEASEAGYAIAKSVFEKRMTAAAGLDVLHERFSLKKSSAGDFINNLSSMLKGKKYSRTNNLYTTDYYLKMIKEDFGLESLNNAISALSQHLEYYKHVKGDLPSLRLVLEKYRMLAKEQAKVTIDQIVDDTVVEGLEINQAKGQGFQMNSKLRSLLEHYAMEKAESYFRNEGWAVEDRSKTCPYDLFCRRGEECLYVEVKGTRSAGEEVILTIGEVEFARSHQGQMALFILNSIQVGGDGDEFVLSEGQMNLTLPWDVDDGALKPIAFMYEVPE